MKKIIKSIVLFTILLYFILPILKLEGVIGIFEKDLEFDARDSLIIESDWIVEKNINGLIGVLVFYPQDFSEYKISIYVNKKGLSQGYRLTQSDEGKMDEMNIFYSYNSDEIEYSLAVYNNCEIENGIYTNIEDNKNLFTFITPEEIGIEKIIDEKLGEIEIYYEEN